MTRPRGPPRGPTGPSGVHLGTSARNHRAIAFYRHLGYEELGADAAGHTFGRRLTG